MTVAEDARQETRHHVELLRDGWPDKFVTPLWGSGGKASRYARSATAAAGTAATMEGNIYVSRAVLTAETAKKLGHTKRVSEKVAAGLVGLSLDIDVIGTPDGNGGTKQTGAPDIAHRPHSNPHSRPPEPSSPASANGGSPNATSHITLNLPSELVDAIVERAAVLVAARQGAEAAERLWTVDELAAYLAVDSVWVRRHQAELGGFRLSDGGGRNPIRFRRADVERFLAKRRLELPAGSRTDWRSDPDWAMQ
jgi:hypothetical protein